MIGEEFGEALASMSITTNGKSAKILSSINHYSLQAYAEQKINKDVPDIFWVLDSNESPSLSIAF